MTTCLPRAFAPLLGFLLISSLAEASSASHELLLLRLVEPSGAPSSRIDASNAEWREAFDAATVDCQSLISAEVPVASGAWCRSRMNPGQRAIAAAPELLWMAASANVVNETNGLGALHALVNEPEALQQDGSGRTFRDEVFEIVGAALHQSTVGVDDLDAMIGRLEELCVRLDQSKVEGELLSPHVSQASTRVCILATALLELERTGSLRTEMPPRSRSWSNAALQAKHGAALLDQQQHLLKVLENGGGSRAPSSLLLMRDFAARRLQQCSRFLDRSAELGCTMP